MSILRRRMLYAHAALTGGGGGGGGGATFFSGAALARINAYDVPTPYPGVPINGGSTLPTCVVIIGVYAQDAPVVSPTIGGNAMTAKATNTGNAGFQIFAANVSAGNGDTFTMSNATSLNKIAVASCWITGMTASQISGTTSESSWTTDTQPINATASLTVPSGGFGISFVASFTSGAAVATGVDWSASTSIVNNAGDSTNINATDGFTGTLAHTATSGAGWTPACSATGASATFNFSAGLLGITIG